MASVANIVTVIASITGTPEASVRHHARQLREAGLLPNGRAGRGGVNAAQAEPIHAARLLIALACIGQTKTAPEAIRIYGKLPVQGVIASEATTEPLGSVSTFHPIEDIPIARGSGREFVTVTRALEDSLAWILADGGVVSNATFTLSPHMPAVVIRYPMGGGSDGALVFAHSAEALALRIAGMLGQTIISGDVFRTLGRLLQPDVGNATAPQIMTQPGTSSVLKEAS